jgi:hypothetical protein
MRRCPTPAPASHPPQQQDSVHIELRPGTGKGAAPHCRRRASPGARPSRRPPRRPSPTRHVPPPTTTGCRKGGCPVISNRPLHCVMQQRCHHSSSSARSPSWLSMPRPRLQRAATAWREKVQFSIREQNQERLGPAYFFKSLVLGPLNSLLWYVPSSRYIWSSAPILFPQEQIKDIIIITTEHDGPHVRRPELLEDPVTQEQKVPCIFDSQLAVGSNIEQRCDFKQLRAKCVELGESCEEVSASVIASSLSSWPLLLFCFCKDK